MADTGTSGPPAEEPGGALEPRDPAPRPRRRRKERMPEPGTPPGLLVADPDAPKPVIRVLAYGPDGVDERAIQSPDEIIGRAVRVQRGSRKGRSSTRCGAIVFRRAFSRDASRVTLNWSWRR